MPPCSGQVRGLWTWGTNPIYGHWNMINMRIQRLFRSKKSHGFGADYIHHFHTPKLEHQKDLIFRRNSSSKPLFVRVKRLVFGLKSPLPEVGMRPGSALVSGWSWTCRVSRQPWRNKPRRCGGHRMLINDDQCDKSHPFLSSTSCSFAGWQGWQDVEQSSK